MSSNYVTARPPGKEHIPLYPKGFVVIRILQLVLAVVCLGLTAFLVTVFPIDGAALMVFTSIIALLSSIYVLVAHFGPPAAYNYWAILGLDIFHVFFWLIAFALLASRAAQIFYLLSAFEYDPDAYSAITAAAAGLGGIEWLLYLISLILHSITLHRHRQAGLHAMPNRADLNTTAPPATVAPAAAGVPAGVEKIQMQPQQPQPYYPPPASTPSPQIYSPSPQTAVSPVYTSTQPTPPPQQVYEAPYAGIQPAERIHEAPEAGHR